MHASAKSKNAETRFACGNSVASGGVIVLQDKEYIAAPARDTIISLCLSTKGIPRIKGRIKTIR
jgi:hypothetical protein